MTRISGDRQDISSTSEPAPGRLRTGDAYKQSLRDGRAVWINGERVEDVTETPMLGTGIQLIADILDEQFDPRFQDLLTYVDEESGQRVSRAWQVPRTLEDLQARRRMIDHISLRTVASYGRPPDFMPLISIGLLAHEPTFRQSVSSLSAGADYGANVARYVSEGRRRGYIGAEVLADPQADRSALPEDAPGLLRIVSVEPGGVVVRGAKSVGSLAAQGDEVLFTNLLRPDLPPEACLWAALPIATPGLKLVCRELVHHPGADSFDHPMARVGEESDQLVVFDNVFIPDERLFNVGDPSLLRLYGPVTMWAHWHILCRLAKKAEIFVGVGQLVIQMLGTGAFPQVRADVARLIEYAQTLRAFVVAAEVQATMTEGGVLAPDVTMLIAGRVHSIEQYPAIIHIVQELCGQGLVMRFTRADFDDPEIGQLLDAILPARDVTAREKNRIMNFIWDLTTDSHAGRTELFENVNATPANFIRERLYREYPKDHLVAMARELAGLE